MHGRIRAAIALVNTTNTNKHKNHTNTTTNSMTAFFMVGLPLYGLGALLYVADVLLDLRRHRVL